MGELADDASIAAHLELTRCFAQVVGLRRFSHHFPGLRSKWESWVVESAYQVFHICWAKWSTAVDFFKKSTQHWGFGTASTSKSKELIGVSEVEGVALAEHWRELYVIWGLEWDTLEHLLKQRERLPIRRLSEQFILEVRMETGQLQSRGASWGFWLIATRP